MFLHENKDYDCRILTSVVLFKYHKAVITISLKGDVVCNIFPSCFKLLLKWSESALFSKLCQEKAITLKNSGGMEIPVGHFSAKKAVLL